MAEEPPDAGIGFTGWFFALLYGGGFLWLLGSTAARAWTGVVHIIAGEQVNVPTADARWAEDTGVTCDVLRSGGGSPRGSTRVRFAVTPPTPGCAVDWSHTSSVDTGYLEWASTSPPTRHWHAFSTTPKEIYDCITGHWAGDTGVCR